MAIAIATYGPKRDATHGRRGPAANGECRYKAANKQQPPAAFGATLLFASIPIFIHIVRIPMDAKKREVRPAGFEPATLGSED